MSNFLDDICFMNLWDWYGKLYIFGKPVSQYLTACNFLNIGDMLMFQHEKVPVDEYLIIILAKITYITDK